jgi:hypothetical protein
VKGYKGAAGWKEELQVELGVANRAPGCLTQGRGTLIKAVALMVHYLILATLKDSGSLEAAEKLMVETRIRLLKIPGVMNLACGKRIDAPGANPYEVFMALDCESMSKLKAIQEHPVFITYQHQVLEPLIAKLHQVHFEMEPGKDPQYS